MKLGRRPASLAAVALAEPCVESPGSALGISAGGRAVFNAFFSALRRYGVAAVLVLLFAGATRLNAASPSVSLAFAAPEANAGTFQPLRLVTDLPGPPRSVVVRLVLPPGARTVRPVDRIDVGGGRARTYIFNVMIPAGLPAGTFAVTGEVRDDSRVWPLHASLRIRADPKVQVARLPADAIIVPAEEKATNEFTVYNRGNVPLEFKFKLQSNPDLQAAIEPKTITLDPGANAEVKVTAQPQRNVNTLLETSLYAGVEAHSEHFVQRDTVGFDFAFMPLHPDPGPLFAQLEGELIPGGLVADNSNASLGFAGRFSLAGNVTAGTRLEMSGADGRVSSAGSRIGLADRDFARVALSGDWGDLAGGLITPPDFGLLEPSTQGRGGLADLVQGEWRTALFATRDTYPGFARETLGLLVRQPDGPWEFGAIAQNNMYTGTPDARRVGGHVQYHWIQGAFDSQTQLAVAEITPESEGVSFGGEERLSWQGEHLSLDGTLQLSQEGFDLAGLSSRESNATLSWQQDPWVGYVRGVSSKDDGSLGVEMQRRRDLGLVQLAKEIVELTTRDTSRRRELEVGVNRQTGLGLFALSADHTDYSTALNPLANYLENSATAGWTKTMTANYAELQVTGGQEHAQGQDTDFLEAEITLSGQLQSSLTYSLNLRRDWNWNGFSTGLRRPGLYSQGSLIWQRRPNSWRIEAGLNVYNYDQLAPSTYAYAVVEMPVSRRFNLGVEANVDTHGGPSNAWVFLRIPLKVSMPWRPVSGALVGRVTDGQGGGLAGALADLNGRHAISDADGRFVLPAMKPGRYALNWRMPGGWTEGADWPREVELRAGQEENVDLSAQKLAVLIGTITIRSDTPGAAPRNPDGAIRATHTDGRSFETTVTSGKFRLGLPPGRYQVNFVGAEPETVLQQLQTTVVIESEGTEITTELAATESRRRMRQTLFLPNNP